MIKRLSKCIREYKRDTILSPVIVSLEVVMDVIIPFLLAFLIVPLVAYILTKCPLLE